MSEKPTQAKCEVRHNEDGSIDEIVVYDHKGRTLVHIEDMGDHVHLGIGCAGFHFTPDGKFEHKKAVKILWAFKPKGAHHD